MIADIAFSEVGFPDNLVYEVSGVEVVRTTRTFGGLMYNSDETDPADLPNTWKELATSEALKGVFMSEPRGISLAPLRLLWTQEEYETFITEMVTNLDPVNVRGTSAQIAKILAGEFVSGDQGKSHEVDNVASEGAPIKLKYLDVVTAFDIFGTIVKDAPEPDAALCYLHWKTLSPEAAEILYRLDFNRNDDAPRDGLPPGATFAAVETPEDVQLYGEAATFYADALEGQTTVE